jgi:hypothetical protein
LTHHASGSAGEWTDVWQLRGDYSGLIECEMFAATYRRFGLATVRFAVVEVEATVTPFDNGLGCTLDAVRVGKPRGWRSP